MASQRITILDGGLGHLMKQRRVETSAAGTEWADSFLVPALANVEAPGAVRRVRCTDWCSFKRSRQISY